MPFVDWTGKSAWRPSMVADQRFAGRRPDVLVYQTPILEDDLRVAGPIDVELLFRLPDRQAIGSSR
ncbi:MAG: hypothetical protein U0872_09965 [Planctomycetaceae bacterium]